MLLLWIIYLISVLFLLCFRARLFIDVLWSPAVKGLTSWLSFVLSNCEVVPLVSWVSCGAWLYGFLIFALFLLLTLCLLLFCRLLFVFKINFLEKIFQEYHQSVKQIWIQIRRGILSGLIRVETVCKGYQQTTPVGKELQVCTATLWG